MIEKTIIAILRKTPTLNGQMFLRLAPDRLARYWDDGGWAADCLDWEICKYVVDDAKLPDGDGFWEWYGNLLEISLYDGEAWPKDYD